MPTRRRRKRNKSPKVLNFSSVVIGMEVGIHPHPSFTLFYPTQNIFGRFGEFWQKKTRQASDRMLQWESKDRRVKPSGANLSVEGDHNEYQSFVLSVDCSCITCSHGLCTTGSVNANLIDGYSCTDNGSVVNPQANRNP